MSIRIHAARGGSPVPRHRRRVVAVIGSGTTADPRCADLGRLIASLGVDLLTGAGAGVMEAVSRAFFETAPRQGVVIGIVPGDAGAFAMASMDREGVPRRAYAPRPGYPNAWVELAIYTHLPSSGDEGTHSSSRNHIVVLSADAVVAMPGQSGTWSEMSLALRYGIPILAFGQHVRLPERIGVASSLDEVRAFIEAMVSRSAT
jgi:predicted Rossmann-fold nucleotide-binding protein